MRLVQIQKGAERRVAVVVEPELHVLEDVETVYELAQAAITRQVSLSALIETYQSDVMMPYGPVYEGASEWRLRTPIDHPDEPSRCQISGTGLTHLGSARDRQSMHEVADAELTDSMKMFRWGLENGKPKAGEIGVAPEWFYKGHGAMLRAHGAPLVAPPYAEDGGEEGEIAGVYLVGPEGNVYRIGMCAGNEFSDHVFEKKNYLNLAGSKLRTSSLGPELVIDPAFDSVRGQVRILRQGAAVWTKELLTGEAEMCHSLQNIEHHHFKFGGHRRPGDVHIHFFGTSGLSFGEGVSLVDGDVMEIRFDGFGRALQNTLQVEGRPDVLQRVETLR